VGGNGRGCLTVSVCAGTGRTESRTRNPTSAPRKHIAFISNLPGPATQLQPARSATLTNAQCSAVAPCERVRVLEKSARRSEDKSTTTCPHPRYHPCGASSRPSRAAPTENAIRACRRGAGIYCRGMIDALKLIACVFASPPPLATERAAASSRSFRRAAPDQRSSGVKAARTPQAAVKLIPSDCRLGVIRSLRSPTLRRLRTKPPWRSRRKYLRKAVSSPPAARSRR
jgi:hypothetical protein